MVLFDECVFHSLKDIQLSAKPANAKASEVVLLPIRQCNILEDWRVIVLK
jgi:hypothetical protein